MAELANSAETEAKHSTSAAVEDFVLVSEENEQANPTKPTPAMKAKDGGQVKQPVAWTSHVNKGKIGKFLDSRLNQMVDQEQHKRDLSKTFDDAVLISIMTVVFSVLCVCLIGGLITSSSFEQRDDQLQFLETQMAAFKEQMVSMQGEVQGHKMQIEGLEAEVVLLNEEIKSLNEIPILKKEILSLRTTTRDTFNCIDRELSKTQKSWQETVSDVSQTSLNAQLSQTRLDGVEARMNDFQAQILATERASDYTTIVTVYVEDCYLEGEPFCAEGEDCFRDDEQEPVREAPPAGHAQSTTETDSNISDFANVIPKEDLLEDEGLEGKNTKNGKGKGHGGSFQDMWKDTLGSLDTKVIVNEFNDLLGKLDTVIVDYLPTYKRAAAKETEANQEGDQSLSFEEDVANELQEMLRSLEALDEDL